MKAGQTSEAESIRRKAEEVNNTPVRIALFGQPGAGKSSLINAIIGEERATVGVATDTTQSLEQYEWNALFLCDLPGYGTAKFPTESYFEKFEIASFDVFICVSSEKFRASDVRLYGELHRLGKRCIFVRNKSDTLFQRGTSVEQLKAQIVADLRSLTGGSEQVTFTSCREERGLEELLNEICDCLPAVKRQRFLRTAKAYTAEFLQQKKRACLRYALLAAGAAAAGT